MDGVRGVHSKLQDTQEPLKKRIELCSRVLRSDDFFLPNKEHVLSDWLCKELHYLRTLQKQKDGEEFVELRENQSKMWQLLRDMLKGENRKHISVSQKFVSVLFEELKTLKSYFVRFDDLDEMTRERCTVAAVAVFACCQELLQDSQMFVVLFNRIDNMEECLMEVLGCFLAILGQSLFKNLKELCKLVTVVLHQYAIIQRQQVAQRKVFGNLCEKFLHLLLPIKYNIHKLKPDFLNEWDIIKEEIASKINSVIVAGLFHKDHLLSYKASLDNTKSEEPSPKKQKLLSYTEQLFEVLNNGKVIKMEKLGKDVSLDWKKSVSINLPFLLESFLKEIKDDTKVDTTIKFNFFVKLYTMISQKDGAISEVDQMTVLNQMLKVLFDYDVYQIAEDNANDQLVFKWFVKLTEHILVFDLKNNAIVFQCLDTLLDFNHKILESVLEKVIERCLVKSYSGVDYEETEKTAFFCNVIETYTKLQQIEYLVKCMVKVIKKLARNFGVIPVCVLTKFAQAFEQCPLNCTFILYKVFLDEMSSLVETMESTQEKFNSGIVLKATTILFVNFLTNSSYNTSDQHGLDQKRSSLLATLLKDTKAVILMPLIEAFTSCKPTCEADLSFSALYLLYGLNEVNSFLKCHNIISEYDDSPPQVSWDSDLGTFIPDEKWKAAKTLTNDYCVRFCLEMLVAQKARYLMVCKTPDMGEIKFCIDFLYDLKTFGAISKAGCIAWNGDPSSITSQNYEVAHWCLIVKHAPLFIPHCSDQQVNELAKFFIRTLVVDDKGHPQKLSLTVSQVSRKLLEGGELHALPMSQNAIVKEFWKLIGESVEKVAEGRFPKLGNIFTWKSLEINEEHKDVEMESERESKDLLKNETFSFTQDLAELMKNNGSKMSKHCVAESEKTAEINDLQEIESLLNLLKILPCSSFIPGNQVRCLVSLLACNVVVTCVTCSMSTCTALQLSCWQTLLDLLQEWLQHRDFTAWKVIDVESFLAWLWATMLVQDKLFSGGMSNDGSSLAEVFNSLLHVAVKLTVKSGKKESLTVIYNFSNQLLISFSDKIKPKTGKQLDVLFSVVLACTELLEEKLLKKPTRIAVSSVVGKSVGALVDPITLFLKERTSPATNTKQKEKLEILVLKVTGVVTKAIGFMSRRDDSTKETKQDRLEDWGELVVLVFVKVIKKLKNVKCLSMPSQIVTYIVILEDICHCTTKHCELLPEDFQATIFRLGLEILRTSELDFKESDAGGSPVGMFGVLEEAILRLFSTTIEVKDGENCVLLLESLVDVGLDNDEPNVKLLTGLKVFKLLLSKKIVKKRKKDLRAKFGNILIVLLSRGTTDVEVLTLILEIIASVLNIGNGALFPHDLALVFQALALARYIKMGNAQQFLRFFTARFTILSLALFYNHDYVYGVIHLFLACANDLLSSLLTEKSKDNTQVLQNCAQKMSRLYQELGSHKDVFRKYATYFLTDCIHLLSTQGIPGVIRETMVEGVHYLLDICEDDTLTKVHMYLPSSDRELFRSFQEDFNKHHKFKGNS